MVVEWRGFAAQSAANITSMFYTLEHKNLLLVSGLEADKTVLVHQVSLIHLTSISPL